MQSIWSRWRVALLFAVAMGVHAPGWTAGAMPESSVILVREADGEGTMKVTNTEPGPIMLTTTIENVPEDQANLVQVTPPVARLEPGQTQLVRFILTADEPLNEQRLKRVIFEGIPQVEAGRNEVKVTVRQNLPLLVLPKNVPEDREPWKRLVWSIKANRVSVSNPSPYVVRLEQRAQLMPATVNVLLPKPYVLPGETLDANLSEATQSVDLAAQDAIKVFPATVYGYMVNEYESVLKHESGE